MFRQVGLRAIYNWEGRFIFVLGISINGLCAKYIINYTTAILDRTVDVIADERVSLSIKRNVIISGSYFSI